MLIHSTGQWPKHIRTNTVLKVVVIGAGGIAQGYDQPGSAYALTHVKAYKQHGAFAVVGICDTDMQKAEQAAQRWNIPNAAQDMNALAHLQPDVISICTPDDTHSEYLQRCIEWHPKLVFCEKPIGLVSARAEELVHDYARHGVLLAVNYSRRWQPEIMQYRERIAAGEFGQLLSARFKYYKGFFHNASHAIDVLNALVALRYTSGVLLSQMQDYTPADATITAASRMMSGKGEDIVLSVEGYDGRKMALFEIELVFDKAKILIEDLERSWITHATLTENTKYPGFFEFSDVVQREIQTTESLTNAVANIYRALTAGEALLSTGESALQTLKLCIEIYNSPTL